MISPIMMAAVTMVMITMYTSPPWKCGCTFQLVPRMPTFALRPLSTPPPPPIQNRTY